MHNQSDEANFMDPSFMEALTTSFLNSYSVLESWQKTMAEGDMQTGEKVLGEWLHLLQTQQESAEDPGKSFATPHDFVKHSFEALANAYEQNVSKMFNIPKVGLTRSYQERMHRCTDEFNRLAMEMGQFMGMLVSPMEKACAELNRNLSASVEPEEATADDPQQLYEEWIKILEQRYQELFHSSDFVHTLHRVLSQYTSFQEIHHRLSRDFLKFSPISSKDEFDEVARENYELKKEVGRMKKRLEALENKIQGT